MSLPLTFKVLDGVLFHNLLLCIRLESLTMVGYSHLLISPSPYSAQQYCMLSSNFLYSRALKTFVNVETILIKKLLGDGGTWMCGK